MPHKPRLTVNPKKFLSRSRPCMKEMISFLNCMSEHNSNDGKCIAQKELLSACMNAQTNKGKKQWGTLNYHLQKLNRGIK